MNTKLHAIADANGRPLSFFMTAGQVSDYTGAAALLDDMPKAQCVNRRPKRTPYRRPKGTPFVEQRYGYDGCTVRAGCGVGRA